MLHYFRRVCAFVLSVLTVISALLLALQVGSRSYAKSNWQSQVAPGVFPNASAQTSDGTRGHLKEADAHLTLAQKYLADAIEQSSTKKAEQAGTEFARAAEEYRVSAAQSVTARESSYQVWRAVGGLMECGHPSNALQLILEHPEASKEPTILHLKADALLALGDRQRAANAYEEWITVGQCGGAYRLSYIKPTEHGDVPIYIHSKRAGKNPCSWIAPELRTRLEILQKHYNHPNNLPPKNYPVAPED